MKLLLTLQCFLLLLTAPGQMARAADHSSPATITRKSLLGRWRGGDTNDLNCILLFEKERARIMTFRGDKHLSTVYAWYHVNPREGKVTLGINGEAILSANGDLKLKLTREFPHIVVLREATLRRMPEVERLP
jgi:hypothetical protein